MVLMSGNCCSCGSGTTSCPLASSLIGAEGVEAFSHQNEVHVSYLGSLRDFGEEIWKGEKNLTCCFAALLRVFTVVAVAMVGSGKKLDVQLLGNVKWPTNEQEDNKRLWRGRMGKLYFLSVSGKRTRHDTISTFWSQTAPGDINMSYPCMWVLNMVM